MKKIPLTKNKFAIVDDEDYKYLDQWKWSYIEPMKGYGGYAFRTKKSKGISKGIYMHRFILGIEDKKVHIDHINHDGLDNRRNNLRLSDNKSNHYNRTKHVKNSSKYIGVFWMKRCKKWRATVTYHYLGLFDSELEASIVRDKKAKELYGEFANLNHKL